MSTVKGIYALAISVSNDISVEVGALGRISFDKGLYVYVGSAQNNLEKRIERHLREAKRRFWHIDYLLEDEAVKVLKMFYSEVGKPEECKTATKLSKMGVPIKGFGSSDCRCKSHLFRLETQQFLMGFMHEIVVAT